MDDLRDAADPKAGREPRPPEPTVQSGWKKAIGVGASAKRGRSPRRPAPLCATYDGGADDRSARVRPPVRRVRARPVARHAPGTLRARPRRGHPRGRRSLTFRGARTVTALDGISLEIAPREVVALIGPNGCGKSTLLRVLAGLIPAERGSVVIDGRPVAGPDPAVGLVFQEPRLLAWRTVEQNVRFPMELAGWSRARQEARASDLLGLVGLREFAHAKPSTLSGGTRQRVSIARALALEPAALLLDEPFSALDALTRERFNAELLNLWQRTGTTIVLVTHSIPEAVFLADRVVVLSPRPGRVVADVRVDLPRPRRLSDLDTAAVSSIAADIRAHLVDTTDDAIALAETRAALEAGAAGATPPTTHEETAPGTRRLVRPVPAGGRPVTGPTTSTATALRGRDGRRGDRADRAPVRRPPGRGHGLAGRRQPRGVPARLAGHRRHRRLPAVHPSRAADRGPALRARLERRHDVAALLHDARRGAARLRDRGDPRASSSGVLLARSRLAERLLSPYLVAAQATPVLALAPLIALWFGTGLPSKLVITR